MYVFRVQSFEKNTPRVRCTYFIHTNKFCVGVSADRVFQGSCYCLLSPAEQKEHLHLPALTSRTQNKREIREQCCSEQGASPPENSVLHIHTSKQQVTHIARNLSLVATVMCTVQLFFKSSRKMVATKMRSL